jgi:hypothetical protein
VFPASCCWLLAVLLQQVMMMPWRQQEHPADPWHALRLLLLLLHVLQLMPLTI